MASIDQRKSKDGKIRYRCRVRVRGYPVQTESFDRKTDAVRWGRRIESDIVEGRFFGTNEGRKHTLGDAIERYRREVLIQKPKSAITQSQQLTFWSKQLGDYLVGDITGAQIIEVRQELLQTEFKTGQLYSPTTANKYMAVLSHLFSTACGQWQWLKINPMQHIKRLKEPRGRTRFLSKEELKRLLEACLSSKSEVIYPIVVLAVSTGMRKGEILGLTWGAVDFDHSQILLRDTKNGDQRTVPLAGDAMTLLKELHDSKPKKKPDDLVFCGQNPQKPMNIETAVKGVREAAGLEDFRFHDLRHTAASYLAMSGASLTETAEILGHKSIAVTKRYSHLTKKHTSKVVERMNKELLGE